MPYFLISIHSPAASSVAEELGQTLLGKQIVAPGFPLTALDTYAFLEFPEISNEAVDTIETEVGDWILKKHGGLRKRRVLGKRQKQILGMPNETAADVVYLEIRK